MSIIHEMRFQACLLTSPSHPVEVLFQVQLLGPASCLDFVSVAPL